ncbi:SDR family oxidoreductase [Streptosporangium sp. 'caverna']|uniref:SDR family oxidoreductase n=1 Tax=Streptosporangium sp. 'caverna' TaxID=2202249 RepID=UPI001EF94AA6|nr:SDR family oxidoreductase [Streptosporangium sp. 'caverna']
MWPEGEKEKGRRKNRWAAKHGANPFDRAFRPAQANGTAHPLSGEPSRVRRPENAGRSGSESGQQVVQSRLDAPDRHPAVAGDIAATVAHLAGEGGRNITGASITVDAGTTA